MIMNKNLKTLGMLQAFLHGADYRGAIEVYLGLVADDEAAYGDYVCTVAAHKASRRYKHVRGDDLIQLMHSLAEDGGLYND